MIRRFLRLALLLAVALAVPLQGAAAVTAGQCMALGHHDMADGHGQTAGDGHQEGHGHKAPSDHDGHCGPCVACCASVAIAPSIMTLSPPPPERAVEQPQLRLLAAGLPDDLDRPPLAL